MQRSFSELHIPFHVVVQKRRKDIPTFILDFCEKYDARNLFANIEYEVDELRRDIEILKLCLSKGYRANFEHDKCMVEPGKLVTKQGHAYAVRQCVIEKKPTHLNLCARFIRPISEIGLLRSTLTYHITLKIARNQRAIHPP